MNLSDFQKLVIKFMIIVLRYMWIDMQTDNRYSEGFWHETENLYREMKEL